MFETQHAVLRSHVFKVPGAGDQLPRHALHRAPVSTLNCRLAVACGRFSAAFAPNLAGLFTHSPVLVGSDVARYLFGTAFMEPRFHAVPATLSYNAEAEGHMKGQPRGQTVHEVCWVCVVKPHDPRAMWKEGDLFVFRSSCSSPRKRMPRTTWSSANRLLNVQHIPSIP